MSNVKISALDHQTNFFDDDLFVVVDSEQLVTRKLTYANLISTSGNVHIVSANATATEARRVANVTIMNDEDTALQARITANANITTAVEARRVANVTIMNNEDTAIEARRVANVTVMNNEDTAIEARRVANVTIMNNEDTALQTRIAANTLVSASNDFITFTRLNANVNVVSANSAAVEARRVANVTIMNNEDTALQARIAANALVSASNDFITFTRLNANLNVVQDNVASVASTASAGKHTMWIPVAAMKPTVSNGCSIHAEVETTAGRPDMQVLDFDSSSDEHAQFQIAFPKSWNESTVTYQAFWTTAATDTDGVAWALQGVAVSNDDTIDVAYGTAVVVTDDALGAAKDLCVTSESGAVTIAGTPAESDICYFRIFRDVSDSNDDMAEDARLIGIKLLFTTNAGNDD